MLWRCMVQPMCCQHSPPAWIPRRHTCPDSSLRTSGTGGLRIRSQMDGSEDWIRKNESLVREAPIALGSASIAAVLLNRALSGIPLVASASSSLSRADVLTLALAASVLLTGLVWKSVQTKPPVAVDLEGVECMRLADSLPDDVLQELSWTWGAFQSAARSRALVVVYQDTCLLQAGVAAESEGQAVSVDAAKLMQGSLCKGVLSSGKQNYLANLALYPGRFELPFLPTNTQAVIVQPLERGVLVLGTDTIRGFGTKDQAWIVAIGQKLQSTLSDWQPEPLSSTSNEDRVKQI